MILQSYRGEFAAIAGERGKRGINRDKKNLCLRHVENSLCHVTIIRFVENYLCRRYIEFD